MLRSPRKRTSVCTRSDDFIYFGESGGNSSSSDKLLEKHAFRRRSQSLDSPRFSDHIGTNYALNKKKCLRKKLSSCNEEPLVIKKFPSYTTIECSAAALEITRDFFDTLHSKYYIKSTEKCDVNKSTESVCLQFGDKLASSPKSGRKVGSQSRLTGRNLKDIGLPMLD